MSTALLEEKRSEAANRPPVVNDFSIHVATANGSGSQSSNTILMRSIFQMGIPVSGKNLFPSNIQGLPTWFTIRASKEGFIARRRDVGVLICMNPETAHEDVRTVLRSGGHTVTSQYPGKSLPWVTIKGASEERRLR